LDKKIGDEPVRAVGDKGKAPVTYFTAQ